MFIAHNMVAMNAQRQYGITTSDRKKKTEKLSSGYKINRAADDAAGLTISEKMRSLIRGLNKGTENAHDGVSWVQIGDGALDEIHDMIHRMTELTIHSLNGTNTDEDRAAMQKEFNQLQSEIDRISQSTQFNTLNIFQAHEPTYYQYEGNKVWPQDFPHIITTGKNDSLTIKYHKDEESPEKAITIKVPEGEYTTQELIDEIDTYIEKNHLDEEGFNLEFTGNGTCSINFEGGEKITGTSGGLQYLLYDMSTGSSLGALIGTTVFTSDESRLYLTNENNEMTFTIQNEDGSETSKTIKFNIPSGQSRVGYTKPELIDILNSKLSDTTVKAVSYGSSIKLESDDSIITSFKGNMFKIETAQPVYTSIFYDNVKYGDITLSAGTFTGGAVLNTNSKDVEHNRFVINDTNNTLVLQPNTDGTPTTITIPSGSYTSTQMAAKLNDLFSDANLEVSASVYSSGSFDGLMIASNKVNVTSKVGMMGGTAYDTLFTDCKYTQFNADDYRTNSTGNSFATLTGTNSLSSNVNYPHTIIPDSNDKFYLRVNNQNYEIKLSAGTYSTPGDLVDEINNQLSSASANVAYKDKITASLNGSGELVIKSNKGSGITSISASAVGSNSAYGDLFRTAAMEDNRASGTGTITLNTPIAGDTVSITSPSFSVNVGGYTRSVSLPTGTRTKDEILTAINTALQPVTTNNTFPNVNASGTRNNISSSNTNGTTTYNNTTLSGIGTTVNIQGTDRYTDTWAKTGTTVNGVPDRMTIDDSNNALNITINNVTKTVTLDKRDYTRNDLVRALQSKIDTAFSSGFGGAIVGLDSSNRLYFTARPGADGQGVDTNISASASSSSLLRGIETKETSGTAVGNRSLNSSFRLDSSNNQFTFNYNDNSYTLSLAEKAYTPTSLITEINDKLKQQGINVQASIQSGTLMLTTVDKGVGNKVSFSANASTNDAFATAAFSGYKTAADVTINCDIKSSITLDGSTNKFVVNGTEVTLNTGTYTRSGFVEMLNNQLSAQAPGVRATLSGNKLRLISTGVGPSSNIQMTYATGGSSMQAIFGTSTAPGAEASFNSDGRMVIKSIPVSTSLYVTSSMGNIFETGSYSTFTGTPKTTTATTSSSYIDGANITPPVKIDEKNDKLKFTYNSEGTAVNVDITLDHKDYTFDELKNALQDKLNESLGSKSGELEASVSSSGVVIKATYPGKDYTFNTSSFSGGFYDRVIRSTTQKQVTKQTAVHDGNQANDDAYTVGRKDVVNNAVDIKKNINDTLSFDLSVSGTTYKISFKLDPGQYRGQALADAIQEKMNDALKAKGLSEGLVKAQIGGVSTGVVGSNDKRALVFKLADDVDLPGTGKYIIDGVGGNAAFSVFYQTDGELTTAYITGSKDVDEPLKITAETNTLEFTFDGHPISITFDEGEYDHNTLVNVINSKLEETGYPIASEMTEKGNLKIYSTRFGRHVIDNFSGSARPLLFNQEGGEIGEAKDILIQLSSIVDDDITIEEKKLSTCFLDINSVCISQDKYSKRALDKLEKALGMVSDTRSYFGAMQNRIESAIRNNENKAENLTVAESQIRDTDMASMLVQQAKDNILMQVGEAMMAQANQSTQGVLSLLQ